MRISSFFLAVIRIDILLENVLFQYCCHSVQLSTVTLDDYCSGSAKKPVARPSSSKLKKKGHESSPDGTQSRPRVGLPASQEPTYYIGGGNGNAVLVKLNLYFYRLSIQKL
jgi:hypothetical protein